MTEVKREKDRGKKIKHLRTVQCGRGKSGWKENQKNRKKKQKQTKKNLQKI